MKRRTKTKDRRDTNILIRVSRAEHDKIRKNAESANKTISAFLRDYVLKSKTTMNRIDELLNSFRIDDDGDISEDIFTRLVEIRDRQDEEYEKLLEAERNYGPL